MTTFSGEAAIGLQGVGQANEDPDEDDREPAGETMVAFEEAAQRGREGERKEGRKKERPYISYCRVKSCQGGIVLLTCDGVHESREQRQPWSQQ